MTGVDTWFRGLPRVLFVHAHPDDESITTGGTLAGLAAAGREPLLVTLTRGEQGEVLPGDREALVRAHGLAAVREEELQQAGRALGLGQQVFLGTAPARAAGLAAIRYEDSGMCWGDDGFARAAAGVGPHALTSVPVFQAVNDLLAAVVHFGALGLVSYDQGGGYGHPDHVFAHRLCRAVATALELPFWQIVPESSVGKRTSVRTAPLEVHRVDPWLNHKIAALRSHKTQLTVAGEHLVHVGGQAEAITRIETFQRVQ